MAVREGWDDVAAEKFQYDVGCPDEVKEWAAKQGLAPEWVKLYWRAHWNLPGIREGFEMMHRLRPGETDTPFNREDMLTLLRISDIPLYFRERLIKISHTPYTRVDIRRMYTLGVLSADDLTRAYMDIGYDLEHAEKMTEFTILYETQGQRDLTQTTLIRAYKRGSVQRSEVISALNDIGYRPEDSELIVSIADYEMIETTIDDELARVEFLYVEGEITESQAMEELAPLNLPSEQVFSLFKKWDIQQRKKVVLPTKIDLEDWYKREIIDAAALQTGLTKRRYSPENVANYMLQLDERIAEELALEMERTQKEQQRLETAGLASNYQIIKAGIDVEIAALRLQIADIKLALHQITDSAEIAEAKMFITQLKDDIAFAQLAKSQIKYEYLGGGTEEVL